MPRRATCAAAGRCGSPTAGARAGATAAKWDVEAEDFGGVTRVILSRHRKLVTFLR